MGNPFVDFGILAGAGAPTRSFKAADIIFRQADPAEELYVVKSGKVDIRLGNRLLDTLPELSIFGEMALIDHSPRSATAVAATDATVVSVGEKQFLFLVIASYLSAKSSHRGESWLAMRIHLSSFRTMRTFGSNVAPPGCAPPVNK